LALDQHLGGDIALLKPWPMCRLPVTFGGGIMMV